MKFRRLGCAWTLSLITACAAFAQEETPKWEVFGGYSFNTYGYVDPGLSGWNASATWNFNRWLGFTADFGGNYSERLRVSSAPQPTTSSLLDKQHTFLFGPRLSLRKERFTIFTHALVGTAVTQFRLTRISPPVPPQSTTDVNFSYVIGGGFDLHAGRRVSFRLIQGDFHYTHPFGSDRDSFRIGAGVVFRIGSK